MEAFIKLEPLSPEEVAQEEKVGMGVWGVE